MCWVVLSVVRPIHAALSRHRPRAFGYEPNALEPRGLLPREAAGGWWVTSREMRLYLAYYQYGRGGGDRKYELIHKACALFALQLPIPSNWNKQNKAAFNAPNGQESTGRLNTL